MGSCSTTGSASLIRFALSNTATQRGRLYATGSGLTSGAVLDGVEESTNALELSAINNCIRDCPLLNLQRICSKISPIS
jgi:hypothetical protein